MLPIIFKGASKSTCMEKRAQKHKTVNGRMPVDYDDFKLSNQKMNRNLYYIQITKKNI